MIKPSWNTIRPEPYTEAGVRRLGCIRCGERAEFQWQICADGRNHRPLCTHCDIELNTIVLNWMKHPNADGLAKAYRVAKLKIGYKVKK